MERDPALLPFVLGLTGGIACGKSQVATFLLQLGVPVLDSDAVVHELYAGGAAVAPVEAAFPGVAGDGGAGGARRAVRRRSRAHTHTHIHTHALAVISRPELSKRVVGDPAALARLEALVHPLVTAAKAAWLREQAARGTALVVLDIPLLFETGAERGCDAVAAVSCPPEVQRQRALARPGLVPDKLDAILRRQLSDGERRRRADFVIDTSVALEETQSHVVALVDSLRGRRGTACAALLGGGDGAGA